MSQEGIKGTLPIKWALIQINKGSVPFILAGAAVIKRFAFKTGWGDTASHL